MNTIMMLIGFKFLSEYIIFYSLIFFIIFRLYLPIFCSIYIDKLSFSLSPNFVLPNYTVYHAMRGMLVRIIRLES